MVVGLSMLELKLTLPHLDKYLDFFPLIRAVTILEFNYATVMAKPTHNNDMIPVFCFFVGEKLPSKYKCTKTFIISYWITSEKANIWAHKHKMLVLSCVL